MDSMKIEVLLTPFEAELVKALKDLHYAAAHLVDRIGNIAEPEELARARAVIAKSEGKS